MHFNVSIFWVYVFWSVCSKIFWSIRSKSPKYTLQKSKHTLQKSTVISYNSAKTSLGIMSRDSQNKVFCGGRSAHFRILRWESTMNEYPPLKLVLHLIIHHIASHQGFVINHNFLTHNVTKASWVQGSSSAFLASCYYYCSQIGSLLPFYYCNQYQHHCLL